MALVTLEAEVKVIPTALYQTTGTAKTQASYLEILEP